MDQGIQIAVMTTVPGSGAWAIAAAQSSPIAASAAPAGGASAASGAEL